MQTQKAHVQRKVLEQDSPKNEQEMTSDKWKRSENIIFSSPFYQVKILKDKIKEQNKYDKIINIICLIKSKLIGSV